MTYGERIKLVRRKLAWTQKELADFLNISTIFVSMVETNVNNKKFALKRVKSLCDKAGYDFDLFLNYYI